MAHVPTLLPTSSAGVLGGALAAYAAVLLLSWQLSLCFKRLQSSAPRSQEGGKCDSVAPSHPPLHRRVASSVPVVLIMLFAGISFRAVLDLAPPYSPLRHMHSGVANEWVASALFASKLPMMMALAAIGLDIGSHFTYNHLRRLRAPLVVFLLFFFVTVFVGMLFAVRAAGEGLVVAPFVERVVFFAGKALAGAAGAAGAAADAPATVDRVAEAARVHADHSVWCFAFLVASVALERSSPELLSSLHNYYEGRKKHKAAEEEDGGGAGGEMSVTHTFMLCVAACQDVFALVVFICCSAVVKPIVAAEGAAWAKRQARLLRGGVATRTTSIPVAAAADGPARSPAHGNAAVVELALVLTSTALLVVCCLLLRRAYLAGVGGVGGAAGPSRKLGLLALLTLTMAGVSILHHYSELLLAAVSVGVILNFNSPCPHTAPAIQRIHLACNVVLFTSMGMRVSFLGGYRDPAVASLVGGAGEVRPAQIIGCGVALFAARTALMGVGGLLGRLAVTLPGDTHAPQPVAAAGAVAEAGAGGEAVPAAVPRLPRAVGLAFLTQLAIALALNARAGEEYARASEAAGAAGALPVVTAPVTQAYMCAVILSMLVGPVLGKRIIEQVAR